MLRATLLVVIFSSAVVLAQRFDSNLRMVLYPTAAQRSSYVQPYSAFAGETAGLPMWNSQYADILRREARAGGMAAANPTEGFGGIFPYYSGMGKGRR